MLEMKDWKDLQRGKEKVEQGAKCSAFFYPRKKASEPGTALSAESRESGKQLKKRFGALEKGGESPYV